VLALIAFGTLLILPNFGRMTMRHRANEGARQIQSILQIARMRSISERKEYVVVFAQNTANLYLDANKNGTRETNEPWRLITPMRLPISAKFAFPANAPDNPELTSLNGYGCKCARFQVNGIMRNPLSGTERKLSVQVGREYRQITVSVGGAISIQRWDAGSNAWQ